MTKFQTEELRDNQQTKCKSKLWKKNLLRSFARSVMVRKNSGMERGVITWIQPRFCHLVVMSGN